MDGALKNRFQHKRFIMTVPGKIRVLECIRQGQIGGGESHLLSLVENMDRSVFEPVVLSFTDGPMIEKLMQMDVETHIIPTTKPFDISKWNTVKNFIKKKEIKLVHAHGTRANSNVVWACKKLRIPLIYTVHGWSFHQDQKFPVKNIRILGERYLTSRSTLNISVSESNQQSGKTFIPSFQSVIINNGINQKKFNPDNEYKNIRLELGIDSSALLVLFIARYTHQKQPLSLIKSFSKALQSNPSLHLLMIGDGEQKEEAKQLIEQLQLGEKITLQPSRQDVPDILAASDIFVLPSLWEGLPIGLLEAMSMGKAIVASNVDGTVEVIEHEKNGLLADTENLVDSTAAAIITLSNNSDLRKRYCAQARKTITERFNASVMTKKIENLYFEVLKNKPN
jgi:glycosyltransferase involved in cell wall biosynthesis